MKKKNFLSRVIATAMIVQLIPMAIAAESTTENVSKTGNILSIQGSGITAEDICVYDKDANLLAGYIAADDDGDGIYTIDISTMEKGPEEKFLKVGEDYYTFYNPYSVEDDFSTNKNWRQVYDSSIDMGDTVINATNDVTPVDGVISIASLARHGGIIIPDVDYKKYSAKSSTAEFTTKLMAMSNGSASSPQLVTHLSGLTRPADGLWTNSQWNVTAKGYGIVINWGSLLVCRMDGDYTNEKSTLSKAVGSGGDCTYMTNGGNYNAGETHKIKVVTETVDGNVNITITTTKINDDGTTDEPRVYTYTDSAPVSTEGGIGINTWNRTGTDWTVDDVSFVNNYADVVTKKEGMADITGNIVSVTKDWDEIEVVFDENLSPFSTEEFTVTDETGIEEKITVSVEDNKAIIDISEIDGEKGQYIFSVKTTEGVKQYKFNKKSIFEENFDSETVNLKKLRIDEFKDSASGGYGFNGNYQDVTVVNGALKAERAAYSPCLPSELEIESNSLVKFKTKNTIGSWHNSPAVITNLSNAYRTGWTGPYFKGYAIFKQYGDMYIKVLDNEAMGHGNVQLMEVVSKDDGFVGSSTEDEFEIEVKTETVNGVFEAVAKLTNLTSNKSAIYSYKDDTPVSTEGYTIISEFGLQEPSGDLFVSLDNLMMTSTDNTIECIKTNEDYMALWAEERTAQTGRDEINFITLGGSITQGAGWSEKVREYFEKEMNKTVNLVNAGIGGTGSSLAVMRLHEDVISKNPDIVLLDHSVNDAATITTTYAGTIKTATYVESIIRELKSLENPPMIFLVDFTTEELLKTDLRIERNYELAQKAFENGELVYDWDYDAEHKKGVAVTDESILHIFKKAYNGYVEDEETNITRMENSALYVSAIPKEYYNNLAEYYNIPQIDIHEFWKKYSVITPKVGDDYTANGNEFYGNGGYDLTVDYEKMIADYSAFATESLLEELKTQSENSNLIDVLLYDKVHCNELAKKIYGDIIVNEFKNNNALTFKEQTFNEKPMYATAFEKTRDIKDVNLTADSINNNKRFEITGNITVSDGNDSYYLKNGVVLTTGDEEATLSYTFYGTSFGFAGTGNAIAAVDGNEKTKNELYNQAALSGDKHIFTLTIPANTTYKLYRIFTDEETVTGVKPATDADNNGIVTIDLTGVVNARGFKSKTGDEGKNMSWQSTGLLKWEDRINHTGTTNESTSWGFIEEDAFLAKLSENNMFVTDTTSYNMSAVKNGARYKAVTNAETKIITTGNVKSDKVYVLAAPGTAAIGTSAIKLNYANGDTEQITAEMKECATTDKIGAGANDYIESDGVTLYEYVFEADETKELESIQFVYDNSTYKNMLVLGVTLKPADSFEKIGVYFDEIIDNSGNTLADNEGVYNISEVMGEKVTYRANLVNVTGADLEYDVILAIYNGNTLTNATKTELTISETGVAEAEIVLPEAEKNAEYSMKVFIWDNVNGMVPVIDIGIVAKG